MRLPTEIVWIAKKRSSVRHISNGDPWLWREKALCGVNVYPAIPHAKHDHLRLFSKCKTCVRIYRSGLNKLNDNAQEADI